jgi:predicted nuclease of predicted toxin-antitoxin system
LWDGRRSLPLKILADESVDFRIVTVLRQRLHDVVSVLKEYQGIPDEDVLGLARKLEAILLTEDSDFGKWVFAHRVTTVGIIFLRYAPDDLEAVTTSLQKVIKAHQAALRGKFVVITPKKIRIREIV